jgi:hypothetical protein
MGEIVSIVFPFVLGGAIYAWGYRVGVRVGGARGELSGGAASAVRRTSRHNPYTCTEPYGIPCRCGESNGNE